MYEKGSALRRNPALTSRNGLRFPHSDPTSFATRNALLLVSTFDRYRVVTSLYQCLTAIALSRAYQKGRAATTILAWCPPFRLRDSCDGTRLINLGSSSHWRSKGECSSYSSIS